MKQGELFGSKERLPEGFVYKPDFITPDEENTLLAEIISLPLSEAKYKVYTAKRRIMSYGASYDFSSNELMPAGPIPTFLHPLRERVARWVKVPVRCLSMHSSQNTKPERNWVGIATFPILKSSSAY